MNRLFLIGAAALTPSLLSAQPAAIIDRAVAAYSSARTIRAEFRQVLVNPLTGTRAVARGVFVRQRPALMSITFTDPPGDRIVADGKAVWVYLPSAAPGQVIRLAARDRSALRIDPATQFLTSPRTRFTMSGGARSTVNGRATREVVLVPRVQGETFTRARIWVDERDGLIRKFEVTEQSGLVREVTVTSLAVNVAVRPSTFTFTPPAGARVIDQERMGSGAR